MRRSPRSFSPSGGHRLAGDRRDGRPDRLAADALCGIALYLLLRIARPVGGEEAVFPALILGTATLYYGGIFIPARSTTTMSSSC